MNHLGSNRTRKDANERVDDAARPRRAALALTAALSCLALAAPAATADHNDVPHSAGDPGRAFELVSPPYKSAGLGVGTNYKGVGSAGLSGFAAYEGERFAVQGSWGSTLLEDAAFSFANDWAFTERRSDEAGWVSHSPITRGGYGPQLYRFVQATGANDDLSLLSWASNTGQLRLFPEQEAWDETSYSNKQVTAMSDWHGSWELFAPTDPAQDRSGGVLTELEYGAFRMLGIATDAFVAAGAGPIGGLAGPGDPSSPVHSDLVDGETVYVDDLSTGVSDTFPGAGLRSIANVCTGEGSQRTEVPIELPGGMLGAQPCPPALPGRDSRLISDRGASMGTGASPTPVSSKNIVSRDGSRVFFMSPDPGVFGIESPCGSIGDNCPPQVYVHQRSATGEVVTRWISRPRVAGQAATLLGEARFEGASEDGSRVFFRTTSPLTADDPNGLGVAPPPGGVVTGQASTSSWDLYMYEFAGPDSDPGAGTLTRISAGPSGGGVGDCNSPGTDGGGTQKGTAALRFASSDGSRVYFACAASLPGVDGSSDPLRAPDRAMPTGDPTTTSDTNLYLYDRTKVADAERWRFVTRLPRSADPVIASCASTGSRNIHALFGGSGGELAVQSMANCVRGNADGSFVTLWTDGRLTVDDDPDGLSGDMYGYDAASDELVRMSAPEAGATGTYTCLTAGDEAGEQCFGDPGLDAGTAKTLLGVATDPVDPADRVAFFQSRSRLVADDTDGAYDVYRWRNGDLSLMTTGRSATDGAFYRGNDRSGRNVYFATRDALTWQDVDSVLDIYTARVGDGIPEPPSQIPCGVLIGACHGAGAASLAAAPVTQAARGGDISPRVRRRIALERVGVEARRRAIRSGRLTVRVRTNSSGVLRLVARARIGGKARRVAAARKRVGKPGRTAVGLRLSSRARRTLRRGRALTVTVHASQHGARRRSTTVTLKRGTRS